MKVSIFLCKAIKGVWVGHHRMILHVQSSSAHSTKLKLWSVTPMISAMERVCGSRFKQYPPCCPRLDSIILVDANNLRMFATMG